MTEVVLVKAVQTCSACPSQWDAWDRDGNYWYLRYRYGYGTAERQPSPDVDTWADLEPERSFDTGDEFGGVIDLAAFCERAGITLELGSDAVGEHT